MQIWSSRLRTKTRSCTPFVSRVETHSDSATRLLLSEASTGRDTARDNELVARYRHMIDSTLRAHYLDALVFPASQTDFSAHARYPQLTVPMMFLPAETKAVPVQNHTHQTYMPYPHQPVGLTFAGTAFTEARLLAFGYAFEQGMLRSSSHCTDVFR
jgi:Asp-tRNA(Asn)/Glu-tRNA(Gln) amidotransferase A subunit family amidase